MPDTPWTGDASSLVDAFRAGDRSPVEELDATIAAIEASDLNAFTYVDVEQARAAAAGADVTKPFGGVPTAIKELEPVAGWPYTEASLVWRDRVADHTSTNVERLVAIGGVTAVGQTTASEFGGLNVSTTRINGTTHNPWQRGRTVGGSSSGSAAAVSGGLISLATGGDGGGSIRIPAGYTGLLGMKGTFGRIPRGPRAYMRPNTVLLGNLSRSVRDAARYYDVCAGVHLQDPSSLPSSGRWEADLGTTDLSGKTAILDPTLGGVTLDAGVEDHIRAVAEQLAADTGLRLVDRRVTMPNVTAQWMLGNLATLLNDLGDRWPGCADDMTDEISAGLRLSQSLYNLRTAAAAEGARIELNEAIASMFSEADFVIATTNPGPAFPAESTMSSSERNLIDIAGSNPALKYVLRALLFGVRVSSSVLQKLPTTLLTAASKHVPDMLEMGALTIPSNICGNPAVSIPAGTVDGLPVGLQVLAPHHHDALLFDLALAMERTQPWPLVAPGVATS